MLLNEGILDSDMRIVRVEKVRGYSNPIPRFSITQDILKIFLDFFV